MKALQIQIRRDYGPVWGESADLHFVGKDSKPNAKHEWLVFLDDSDVSGALGFHDLSTTNKALGKVFTRTNINAGYEWTVAASHEILEMMEDPYINLTADDGTDTLQYAYEIADAVEADELGYTIDVLDAAGATHAIKVSDFVKPEWFEPNTPREQSSSFRNNVFGSFTLAKGGYISVRDLTHLSRGWQQLYGDTETPAKYTSRPPVGSRRERRRLQRSQWLKSTVETEG